MSIKLRTKALKSNPKAFSYYLDIYEDGKRSYEFLNIHVYPDEPKDLKKQKQELAEKIKSQRHLDQSHEEHGIASIQKRKANFILYYKLVMNRREGNTKQTWETSLKHLIEYAGEIVPFKKINKKWVEEYKEHLLSAVSPGSADTYFSKLKKALSEAVKDEIIATNPAKLVDPISVPEKQVNYLDLSEIQKIAETDFFNPEVKKAFLFSCFTGLRMSDLRNLKWSNIEKVSNGKSKKPSYTIKFNQTKTKASNSIPLNKNALDLIGKPKNPNDNIFNLSSHAGSINRTLRKLLTKAEITKKITFHGSRHTNATLLLTSGADFYTVSKLLGHRDIKSTMRYAKVVDPLKKKAVDSIPQIKL